MGKSSALAGIIGLILLIFGIVDYFIASGFRFFVFVNVIAGRLRAGVVGHDLQPRIDGRGAGQPHHPLRRQRAGLFAGVYRRC